MSEAKEFFQQIRNVDKQIDVKLEHLERLKALATKCTSVMREDNSKSSGVGRGMESSVEKIISLQDEINADIDRLVDLKRKAIDIIGKLQNEKQRICLEERYLNGKSLEKISVELDITYRWACIVHGKALKNAEKIMKSSE